MIGYVILAVWLASVVLTGLWMIWQYRSQTQGTRMTYADVMVKYQPYAEEWPDLDTYLRNVRNELWARYSIKDVLEVLTFTLIVIPHNKPVVTREIPDGFVTKSDGTKIKVTGSMETKRYFFGLVKRRFVYIRQNEFAPNEIRRTALLHEIIEHILPLVLTGDSNAGHAKTWLAIKQEIQKHL